ncbi:MAG TPA: ATP-binding protein [Chloroflexia bacterium]|nr:ATP-binding protein [Chloroflexia bacterium]
MLESPDTIPLRPEQVEALLTISTMLNSDLNVGRVLRDLMVHICSLFRANRAAVFLREKLPIAAESGGLNDARKQDIGRVVCAASTGLTDAYLATLAAYYEKNEFIRLQANPGPVFIADAVHDRRLNGLRNVNQREGFQTMLTLPLLHQDALIGTLVLYHNKEHYYTTQENRLLNVIANQAATAIANARLFDLALTREREAAQLADASRVFSGSLKTSEVLNRVVRVVGEMIGNSALTYIIQEGTEDAYPVAFYSKAVYDGQIKATSPVKLGQPIEVGDGVIGKAMQSGVPFLIQDSSEILKAIPFANAVDAINSIVCVPLKTRGRIIGALLSYHVTYGKPHKKLEEEHLGLLQSLADRAAVAIENARMYDAEKREKRVKDEFLTLVSHELNTPVTNIKGFNHILSKKLDEVITRMGEQPNRTVESLRHYTDVIGSQVDRLQSLIGDLAKIPLIESGQLELNLETVEILPLLQAVLQQTQKALKTSRGSQTLHQFELVARQPELKAAIDREAFVRILETLLSNAVKFSPKGGTVRVELSESSAKTIKISVADQGIGISAEDIPHIFERFYKASSYPSRANGLGLGLYISQSLAEAMNGKLQVNSTEGKGSTFTLRLPRAVEQVSSYFFTPDNSETNK